MRKILLLTLSFFLFSLMLSAQTVLQGTVIGPDGLGVIQAQVQLLKGGEQIKGTVTDLDGSYVMSNIDGGTYDVKVTYLGLSDQLITGVVVKSGSSTKLDFTMGEDTEVIDEIEIKAYKVPLIDFDKTESSKTVTSEGIRNLGFKSVQGIAATTSGLSTQSGSDDISIRGSRSNATNYIVDGIRVSGLPPVSDIEQMQVITGGLSAEYGDVTGGVISITSKGPSSNFSGAAEVETSEFLDAYGYNFGNISLSGPIIRTKAVEGKKRTTILGFRLTAQALYQLDDRPSRVGVYRMPENIIKDLEANPVYKVGQTSLPRAELLGKEVLPAPIKTRPNEDNLDIGLSGKLDLRINKRIDMSFSGFYGDEKDRFTPGGGWALLNYTRNPYEKTKNSRYSIRWRHKIGVQDGDSVDEDVKQATTSLIRNASYIIQAGYETTSSLREDLTHQDQFFRYGQYGTQEISSVPAVGRVLEPKKWTGSGMLCLNNDSLFCFDHNGYQLMSEPFNPYLLSGDQRVESPNPVLSKYQSINGRLLGAQTNVWGRSYFINVGRVYNNYRKYRNDRITVNLSTQLDILPNGSNGLRHNLKLGAVYETRTNRRYSINPRELWTLARSAANSHILAGVDTTNFVNGDSISFYFQGAEFKFPQYKRLIKEDASKLFYKSIREQLGLKLNDYVNIDGANVDASKLSLAMFSPGELISFQDIGLDYYGYDYLGNEINGVTFNDFFKARKDGRRTFPVAAINPTYISGFIQDKFTYRDIILRLGVRAEYFDANTKVAKDPYSLYAIQTAKEFSVRNGQVLPEAVGDDYKVYVEGPESDKVVAYRLGDQWYDVNGTATEGNLLFQGQTFPAYKFDNNDISSPDFNPDNSFEDYKPTFNLSPRISLSFPISESAGFFAHYDELVQRPSSGTTFTALDYYFFNDIGRLNPNGAPANNPNLKPQKTIDYEVGFQQKLTESTALKLSAYYRENRDMIQTRYYQYASITAGEYKTYGNIDFGTVKGFTAAYDFRRTYNIEFSVSYSLQYAEGTGSSSNSGLNTSNGLVRVLVPLDFDERHRIVGNIDYRYQGGDRYNGPKVMGYDIFANTGLNLQMSAVSGRPYTKLANPNSPFSSAGFTGDINGARLPWNFNIDARLDKSFRLFGGEKRKGINLNIYARVSNLLNAKNVIGVYSATGSADDDGFLSSSYGQDAVKSIQNSGKDVQNYLAAYQWALLSPGFYALPRRIFVGAIVEF